MKNPFRYRSYYYDFETGLYYLNSRYYDPELGRFVNADDIGVLQESKNFINGLNLYSYCNNNPISNIDDCGHAWWHWLIAAFVVVAAAIAVVATAGGVLPGIFAVNAVIAGGSASHNRCDNICRSVCRLCSRFYWFCLICGDRKH